MGEWIIAAPSRGLPFLRDPSVYIQAWGLCSGGHIFGCGGKGFGSRVWFRVGRSIKRAFAMIDGGFGGVFVIEW